MYDKISLVGHKLRIFFYNIHTLPLHFRTPISAIRQTHISHTADMGLTALRYGCLSQTPQSAPAPRARWSRQCRSILLTNPFRNAGKGGLGRAALFVNFFINCVVFCFISRKRPISIHITHHACFIVTDSHHGLA